MYVYIVHIFNLKIDIIIINKSYNKCDNNNNNNNSKKKFIVSATWPRLFRLKCHVNYVS